MECTGFHSVTIGTSDPLDESVSAICVEYSVLAVAMEDIWAKLLVIPRPTTTLRVHVYDHGRTPPKHIGIRHQKCESTKKRKEWGAMYGYVQRGQTAGEKNNPELPPGAHPIGSPPLQNPAPPSGSCPARS